MADRQVFADKAFDAIDDAIDRFIRSQPASSRGGEMGSLHRLG
jgi:hypothetical protein